MNRCLAAIHVYLDNGGKFKFSYEKQDNLQVCDAMFFDGEGFVVIKASNTTSTMINKSKIVEICVIHYADDS